jgi:beta-fructofuranosidase
VLDDGPACYAPQVLVDGDRRLLWGWAWELDRSPAEVAAAGWAGVLTFPRELALGTDGAGEEVLVCRPAAELVGLRGATLPWTPGRAVREPAFELVATGPVRLLLERHGRRTEVVATAGTPADPARLLVDGSLVETFAAGRCRTDRAYPGEDRGWFVEAAADQVVVHRLARIGPTGA